MPFLELLTFIYLPALFEIPAPSPADYYCIALEGFYKLFIILELMYIFRLQHVLLAISAFLVDWESPPVIMGRVNGPPIPVCVQLLKLLILVNTFLFEHCRFLR